MSWILLFIGFTLAWIVLRQYKYIQASLKTVDALISRCVVLYTALQAAEKEVKEMKAILDAWHEPMVGEKS